MKTTSIFTYLLSLIIILSCASNKKNQETFWVAGYKTEVSNGAGKSLSYLINKNSNYETGTWENFYSPIKGFTFEAGSMKQITVTKKKLDAKQTPADASSIEYTLLNTDNTIPDPRVLLSGDWILVSLNGHPINRMVVAPNLSIDLNKNRYNGLDGCNNFSGSLVGLSTNKISFGNIAVTSKACIKEDISADFYKALAKVNGFVANEKELKLNDANFNNLLGFIRK